MKKLILLAFILSTLISCTTTPKKWAPSQTIDLGKVSPIGFTLMGEDMWVADGDHNRLVLINKAGNLLDSIENIERPMHIDGEAGTLYIPAYGSDEIIRYQDGKRDILPLVDSLDAPAGISVKGKEIAIADFYHHRILFFDGNQWHAYGREGKKKGEFYYPTDVQLFNGKIYVADAYNNRIQVLSKAGEPLQMIGENENINAATGLYIDSGAIYLTDFENDRILVFDHEGIVQEIIEERISKPTDILIDSGELLITNYKAKNIVKYSRK